MVTNRKAQLAAALQGTSSDPRGDAEPDPAVRLTALLAASRRDHGTEDSADLEPVLTAGLKDPDPAVRRGAAEACAMPNTISPAFTAELVEMLKTDTEAYCREAAAFSLGETGAAPAARTLETRLSTEESPLVREAIAGALGSIGDPNSLKSVISLTTNEKPAVRRRAVVALAAFDSPDADKAIQSALADRDRYVREAAEWLLRED